MDSTDRLGLPMISPGQAQKELFHNEALQLLDALVAGAVEEPATDPPPVSPAIGECYIVGDAPSGVWSGHAQAIASFSSGGWRFINPVEGMAVYVRSTQLTAVYNAGAWDYGTVRGALLSIDGTQVVGSQAVAIESPAGGSTVDSEARVAISEILAALRQHGLIAT